MVYPFLVRIIPIYVSRYLRHTGSYIPVGEEFRWADVASLKGGTVELVDGEDELVPGFSFVQHLPQDVLGLFV